MGIYAEKTEQSLADFYASINTPDLGQNRILQISFYDLLTAIGLFLFAPPFGEGFLFLY